MRATKEQNLKNKKLNSNSGITLIALIITIIVMLVLIAVTISVAVNGGLFEYAGRAGVKTNEAIEVEQILANGTVKIDGVWYESIEDYLNNKPSFNAKYWDKKAAPEDVFIWQSDDPNDEGYGVIVGYTANIDNYPSLRIPSRCTKIEIDSSYIDDAVDDEARRQMRSYTQNIKEVELPDTVVVIGKEAFGNYSFASLEKINIPKGITVIGDSAFHECNSLTNVTIPNSVTTIGNSAFYSCDSLTNVIIPNSVTTIGDNAFYSCENLTTVTIPSSVTTIGNSAFYSCDSLTNVIIPNSVTTIGDNAFYYVKQITYNGTAIGSPWGALSVVEIEEEWAGAVEWDKKAAPEDVFIWQSDNPNDEGYGVVVGYTVGVDNYPTLRFPSRCTKVTLDSSYIQDNTGHEEIVRSYTQNIKKIELPNTVVEIGKLAFSMGNGYEGYRFSSVKKIRLSDNLKIIGEKAFYSCNSLTTITIPDSVTSIGPNAFANCTNLTGIVIPDTVANIGKNAFSKMVIVYYNGLAEGAPWGADLVAKKEEWNGSEKWDEKAAPEDVFIWKSNDPNNVGYGMIIGYTSNIDNYVTLRIPSRCKIIYSYGGTEDSRQIRSYTQNIKEIELPNTVLIIGDEAFYNAGTVRYGYNFDKLQKVSIPNSVKLLGDEAFANCTALTSVTIPDSVTSIGKDAFYNVPHIVYNGTATGSPWGALSKN